MKDADADIIQLLKARGVLVANARIVHNVPFCPRSETPLIYKVQPDGDNSLTCTVCAELQQAQ